MYVMGLAYPIGPYCPVLPYASDKIADFGSEFTAKHTHWRPVSMEDTLTLFS